MLTFERDEERRNPTQIYVSCSYPLKIFVGEPKAVQKFSYICALRRSTKSLEREIRDNAVCVMLMQHNGLAFIINTTGDISKSWVTGMIPKLVPQMSFTTDP